jgi:hypothetical protein
MNTASQRDRPPTDYERSARYDESSPGSGKEVPKDASKHTGSQAASSKKRCADAATAQSSAVTEQATNQYAPSGAQEARLNAGDNPVMTDGDRREYNRVVNDLELVDKMIPEFVWLQADADSIVAAGTYQQKFAANVSKRGNRRDREESLRWARDTSEAQRVLGGNATRSIITPLEDMLSDSQLILNEKVYGMSDLLPVREEALFALDEFVKRYNPKFCLEKNPQNRPEYCLESNTPLSVTFGKEIKGHAGAVEKQLRAYRVKLVDKRTSIAGQYHLRN